MDLSNFINNEKLQQVKNEFNSANFDFDEVAEQNLVNVVDNKCVDVQKIQKKQQKENMIKDLFSLLANSSDISYIIKQLKTKYGSLVDDKVITCCMKLCDVIGNYLITCRYNDNLGNKNPTLVKYVLFCDCGDKDCVDNEVGVGSVDGFFQQNKKVAVSKVKMCKKHNLPVLASIDDLTQQDFNQLVKKVAQVNQIQPQQNKNAKVVTKIARIFNSLRTAKKVKHDNLKYALKQANTQLTASVSNKMQVVNLSDVAVPKQKDFTVTANVKDVNLKDVQTPKEVKVNIKKSNKYDKVNMPTNNITVNVKQSKKDMDAFTITANKYDDLQLADVKDKNVNIMAKNMNVAVEKQAKYVENICIKTKPVDNGFDMEDDFVFDIENKNNDNIVIDTRSDFNF